MVTWRVMDCHTVVHYKNDVCINCTCKRCKELCTFNKMKLLCATCYMKLLKENHGVKPAREVD